MSEALESMLNIRREIESRLFANADYRALLALDRAISELNGPPPPFRNALAHVGHFGANALLMTGQDNARTSQTEAVAKVLRLIGRPMTTAELIEPIRAEGATLSSEDPAGSLSSSLSRDKDRFQSVRWRGRSSWWFKNEALPDEERDRAAPDRIRLSHAIQSILAQSEEGMTLREIASRLPPDLSAYPVRMIHRELSHNPNIVQTSDGNWIGLRGENSHRGGLT